MDSLRLSFSLLLLNLTIIGLISGGESKDQAGNGVGNSPLQQIPMPVRVPVPIPVIMHWNPIPVQPKVIMLPVYAYDHHGYGVTPATPAAAAAAPPLAYPTARSSVAAAYRFAPHFLTGYNPLWRNQLLWK